MSRTIIVGIDGSANSEAAVTWAIAHAKRTRAEIRLVAAYTVPGVSISRTDIVRATDFDAPIKHAAESLAESTAARVSDAGVPVSAVVSPGDASGVLIESSATADLAVVGARGRGGFAGRLLGSVALAMPAHAHCPTIVIPTAWPKRPIPEKSMPVDLPMRWHHASFLDAAGNLIPDTDGSTDAFHQSDPSTANLRIPDYSGEVVAAVDPFEADSPVLRDAAQQAQFFGLPLHILGVTATHILSAEWLPSQAHLTKLYDDAATQREITAAALKEEFPDISVRWSIFDAPVAEVLVLATHSAELMVIGSRGRGGFVATLLGSTSQAVLAHSLCPTRVIRVEKRPARNTNDSGKPAATTE